MEWNIGDISDWNTSSVTDMSFMFSYSGYSAITWDIGNLSEWDTSSVTTMRGMFYYAGNNASYSLDLSSWNVDNVTNYTDFNGEVESKIIAPTWVISS